MKTCSSLVVLLTIIGLTFAFHSAYIPHSMADDEEVVTKEERMYQLKLEEAELKVESARLEMEKYRHF